MICQHQLAIRISGSRHDRQRNDAAGDHAKGIADYDGVIAGVVGLQIGELVGGVGCGWNDCSIQTPVVIHWKSGIGGHGPGISRAGKSEKIARSGLLSDDRLAVGYEAADREHSAVLLAAGPRWFGKGDGPDGLVYAQRPQVNRSLIQMGTSRSVVFRAKTAA